MTPTGVTAEALAVMLDRAAGEVNKLIVAMTFANQQVADSAGVLKLDFSSRRPAVTPSFLRPSPRPPVPHPSRPLPGPALAGVRRNGRSPAPCRRRVGRHAMPVRLRAMG